MPLNFKLWQVKGKDLQEVGREALSDGRQLEDWLVNGNGNAAQAEADWVVVSPEPVVVVKGRKKGLKANPQPIESVAVKETRTRADAGDPATQTTLGFMYELGLGVPVDWAEAVKWYRKAADQGDSRAQLNLRQIAAHGFMYERGSGGTGDVADAVKKCRKAAEKGNARAEFNLGQMYEWGNGVAQDLEEAVSWYEKSAEQGSTAAQFQLGQCYCNGRGVQQDTAAAVKWWSAAAEHGDVAAQYQLGLCYCNGQGVPQDYAAAVRWYREAAEQGDAKAQGKLGDSYYIGLGVQSDYAEALKWYREAAEHGDAGAQRHLGIMYGLGQGVPQDRVESFKWYDLAAAQHDNNAIHNRDGLAVSLTAAQVSQGRKLSQEFIARRENGNLHRTDLNLPALAAPAAEEKITVRPSAKTTPRKHDLLGVDVLLIGRDVVTGSSGRIDLLAIDAQGNLVVLVLKRDKEPHELLAQTLDNASWVNTLSHEQINTIARAFAGKALAELFNEHYGTSIPEKVNSSHSMLILTSDLDDSSDRIVRYLAAQHRVPIHVIFIAIFKTAFGEFLGRAESRALSPIPQNKPDGKSTRRN